MGAHNTKLVILRHAESLEDIDNTAYERIADEDMSLSEKGRWQASIAGKNLFKEFGDLKNWHFILSPSKRVLETAEIIVSELPSVVRWSLSTEKLIVKQNWGNVTVRNRKEIEAERYRAGVLRYCFPGGESGADMLSRFAVFAEKLEHELKVTTENELTIVITHGFEIRILLKSLFHWSEEYFESLAHPKNCEMKRISLQKIGTLTLLDEMRRNDPSSNINFIPRQNN